MAAMRVHFFSTKPYEIPFFEQANREHQHELVFLESRLLPETVTLAQGAEAVCVFVNDDISAPVVGKLADQGTKVIALRSAGFNNVDLDAAREHGVTVVRVPAYSPYAVAEHTLGLILSLNRNIHRAFNRVRERNFALDGLLGFDLKGRTVGIIGTGKIGQVFAGILSGFGVRLLAYDVRRSPECEQLGVRYVELDELFRESDIISLHCPLTEETHHLIGNEALARMKKGVMLINTSRGGLLDTPAVIEGLKDGTLGALALDVYEEEGSLFFEDQSNRVLQDDVFARLLTFPNVLITGHQAFFTREALTQIATVTLGNLAEFETTGSSGNAV